MTPTWSGTGSSLRRTTFTRRRTPLKLSSLMLWSFHVAMQAALLSVNGTLLRCATRFPRGTCLLSAFESYSLWPSLTVFFVLVEKRRGAGTLSAAVLYLCESITCGSFDVVVDWQRMSGYMFGCFYGPPLLWRQKEPSPQAHEDARGIFLLSERLHGG